MLLKNHLIKVFKQASLENNFLLKENVVLKWVHRFGIDSLNDLLIHSSLQKENQSEEEKQEQITLIDENQIDYKSLYGSWAGAFGFFQFMPSTIKNHAIDFNTDNYIDLKNSHDAYASAANYLKKIGWKKDSPCFYRIDLKEDIPKKYLNVSAKKLQNKKKLGFFKKYIDNYDDISFLKSNYNVAIITPDKDIIPGADTLNPAYIVFDNYEIILQWNRSLRFALAVCTLKDKFKNEL